MSSRPIRHGGLMRCCIASIGDYDGPEEPGKTAIPCQYHTNDGPTAKLATDGIWEWVNTPVDGRGDAK